MREVVKLFVALNIETRYGKLKDNDLRGRRNQVISYGMKKPIDGEAPPPLIECTKKYESIELTSNTINDEAAVSMFVDGSYDSSVLQRSMDSSVYFVKPEALPPWLALIQFQELTDEEAEHALAALRKQIEGRLITDPGELLHAFSLCLLMSYFGLIDLSKVKLLDEAKQYIAELMNEGRLPPRDLDYHWIDRFNHAHGGYVYWVDNDYKKEFLEIFNELVSARTETLRRKFPEFREELYQKMKIDGQSFYADICPNSLKHPRFAFVPVFSGGEATYFVKTLLESHPRNWHWISSALKDRYEGNRLQSELSDERKWISSVVDLIDKEAAKSKGFRSIRLKRFFDKAFRDKIAALPA
jgi:hypothetical protein